MAKTLFNNNNNVKKNYPVKQFLILRSNLKAIKLFIFIICYPYLKKFITWWMVTDKVNKMINIVLII